MEASGHEFLQRKFMHLFKCFEHTLEGHIVREDAEKHKNQLDNILRQQLKSQGLSNDVIEKKIAEFDSDWFPSAMHYFGEMTKFAKNQADISVEEFMAFNMSIRDHIIQRGALPSWFENSLRASFTKCWSNKDGILLEEGFELLPGVTKDNRTWCHQHLTENNNKKIDVMTFLDYIKEFYSNEDPHHMSKYIHGYLEE